MIETFTQTDSDNFADIIWWIKGYVAGTKNNFEECPFEWDHYESLRKARVTLGIKIKEIEKEKENE